MNDIIRSIEAEQLKAEVQEFHVGDTIKVYGKMKPGENSDLRGNGTEETGRKQP